MLGLKKISEMQQWAEFAGAEGEAAGEPAPCMTHSSSRFQTARNPVRWSRRELQFEGAEGNTLRGDVQRTAEGEFSGALPKRFVRKNLRDLGRVVLLGEMPEDQMARQAVEHFRISEEFADHCVREMSGAAHHALLDVPGI